MLEEENERVSEKFWCYIKSKWVHPLGVRQKCYHKLDIWVKPKIPNAKRMLRNMLQQVSNDRMLKLPFILNSEFLCPHRVTRTHRHPQIHPWPRLTHQPSLHPLPRTAFRRSSQLHIPIHIHTHTHIHTQQQRRTTAESRPPSASIHSTCTSPHRATASRARQTPAARRSPAQPQ